MTFKEWIIHYRRKTNDPTPIWRKGEGDQYTWHPDKGFIVFSYHYFDNSKILNVHKVCGDAKYWLKRLDDILLQYHDSDGAVAMCAFTEHNPRAMERLFKCKEIRRCTIDDYENDIHKTVHVLKRTTEDVIKDRLGLRT